MSRASNAYIFLPSQNSAVTSLKPHAELLQRDKGAVVAVLSSPPSVLRFEGTGAIHRWLASRPRFGCTHTLYVVAVVLVLMPKRAPKSSFYIRYWNILFLSTCSFQKMHQKCNHFLWFLQFFQVMFTCLHKCSSHLKPKQEI